MLQGLIGNYFTELSIMEFDKNKLFGCALN